ncbi:MAG TPA: hypothetical protein VEW28_01200 [Candidatus Kapabacteria bacterium]|nr:hypothetical protein [Candidatus Kapabacteria bacterium]
MRATILIISFMTAAAVIGCESDTPNYNQYAHVLLFDSSYITFDSAASVLMLNPVRADVSIKTGQSGSLHDTAIIYTYAHGLVADSLRYNMRKTYYELADTVFFHYDQAVDSLGAPSPNPALFDQFRLDSIHILTPSVRPPKVITSPK